jgi:hypothetical protein
MKTQLITFSALALTTSGLCANMNFSKSTLIARAPVAVAVTPSPLATQPPSTTAPPVPAASVSVEQLFAEADSLIDSSTQDSHAGLSSLGDRVTAGIKNQINAWKSEGYTAPLPSDEELSRALLDFTQKLSLLNLADESTWTSVKTDTLGSLHHLQGVFGDLRTDSVKKK